MKAVVFSSGKVSYRKDRPLPQRREGEAIVKVLVAGICNTDIEIFKGYMNFSGVPGHEFVGVVDEAGDPRLVGKRVVGEINCGCGQCGLCASGMARHCRSRSVLGILNRDGAFAEYLSLPEANLHLLPDHLSDERAAFVEPVAACYEILEQIAPRENDRCLVLGDGKLGLLVAQVMATRCRVQLLGHNERKVAVAKGLGIEASAEGAEDWDYDIAIDATGSPSGLHAALELLKPRGTLVLKTTIAGETPVPLARLVIDEITVVGSRCGPFEPAIRALSDGTVRVDPLVTDKYALWDFDAALARARSKGAFKVLVYPGGLR